MPTLRVEHGTPNFDAWKQVFDKDPIDRKGSGVRRHRMFRAQDDPNFVIVDLEFDSTAEAEAFLGKLRAIWEGPGKAVMVNPPGRILDLFEEK